MIRSGPPVRAASFSEAESQCELYLSRRVPLTPNHSKSTRAEPRVWRPEVWRVRQVKELHTKLNVGLLCDWKVLENGRIKLTDSRRASVRQRACSAAERERLGLAEG